MIFGGPFPGNLPHQRGRKIQQNKTKHNPINIWFIYFSVEPSQSISVYSEICSLFPGYCVQGYTCSLRCISGRSMRITAKSARVRLQHYSIAYSCLAGSKPRYALFSFLKSLGIRLLPFSPAFGTCGHCSLPSCGRRFHRLIRISLVKKEALLPFISFEASWWLIDWLRLQSFTHCPPGSNF